MSDLTSVKTRRALKELPRAPDISHIPGDDGPPLVGNTLRVLADPEGAVRRMYERFGPVYRSRTFGYRQVTMLGPEANELVLFDREGIFSSELGWTPTLERLFPRGLMLLDFEVHRAHRRIMGAAFKPGPMAHYTDVINRRIPAAIAGWADREDFRFYPAIKALTLDIAAEAFLGLPLGAQADRINQAFVDMVAATVAPVRRPWPGTAMRRGVRGRKLIAAILAREIPARRGSDAPDMFTVLCNATDEAGAQFSDREIIDHMNFLMMAAHDTLTSSLTSAVYEIARNPVWQDRMADELAGVAGPPGQGDLPALALTERIFKEALRLNPPVPALPRRALRAFTFAGYTIPAGAYVGINPLFTHRDSAVWPDPLTFDPDRFLPEAVKARHKYAWAPFGGGAHMCLGLHFAIQQAKLFFWHFLKAYRVRVPDGYACDFQMWPMCKPRDGLPVTLTSAPARRLAAE